MRQPIKESSQTAYRNVRATGGAVEPLPWRGLRGWGEGRSPLGRGVGDRKDGLGIRKYP